MRIIGAGFGRTGTTSLKAALETLGFGPSYRLDEVFKHPEQVAFWEAASRGERVDWEGFFAGYGVAVDWPTFSFYKELMQAFPGATVILTVRDPDRWYESVRSTLYGIHKLSAGPAPVGLAFALAGLLAPAVTGIARLADRTLWDGLFDGRFEDRSSAIETFRRHNEEVRRHVPPERLLVYDVKEGWAPLCAFLGVDVPDRPFPHLNDTREMRRRLIGLAAASATVPVLAVATVLAALAYLLRRARS